MAPQKINGYIILFFVMAFVLNIFIVHFEAKFVIFPAHGIKKS